jgi:ABC-2 type transport system ATP-binding protein
MQHPPVHHPPTAIVAIVIAVLVVLVAACLTDLVRGGRPRNLPRWAWAILICAVIPWGGLAYLAVGRTGRRGAAPDALAPVPPSPPAPATASETASAPPQAPATASGTASAAPQAPPGAGPRAPLTAPALVGRPAVSPVAIELDRLTKRFGTVAAVSELSLVVRPGKVTGFLGPNGAGKTTTMRLILGLDLPTSGTALVGGRRYREITRPLHQVGSLLDATAVHGGRPAWDHLLALARSNGIGRGRARQVLELTGLEAVANRRAGEFSLGMKQRLGIAVALLADPAVLMLDEPVNGLDAEGVRWIRQLLTSLAAEGRTVLISSHLMSEMAMIADHLIIIGRGQLLADTPAAEFVSSARRDVLVKSPRTGDLGRLLTASGSAVRPEGTDGLAVTGLDAPAIGDLALAHGIAIHELVPRHASLEDAYLDLTLASTDYHARITPAGSGIAP